MVDLVGKLSQHPIFPLTSQTFDWGSRLHTLNLGFVPPDFALKYYPRCISSLIYCKNNADYASCSQKKKKGKKESGIAPHLSSKDLLIVEIDVTFSRWFLSLSFVL